MLLSIVFRLVLSVVDSLYQPLDLSSIVISHPMESLQVPFSLTKLLLASFDSSFLLRYTWRASLPRHLMDTVHIHYIPLIVQEDIPLVEIHIENPSDSLVPCHLGDCFRLYFPSLRDGFHPPDL